VLEAAAAGVDARAYTKRWLDVAGRYDSTSCAGSVGLCAKVRDEGRDMADYVAWWSVVGVDRFYLYTNGSVDDTYERLRPFMASGRVRLMEATDLDYVLYNECLSFFGSRHDWMAFVDGDEFAGLPDALMRHGGLSASPEHEEEAGAAGKGPMAD